MQIFQLEPTIAEILMEKIQFGVILLTLQQDGSFVIQFQQQDLGHQLKSLMVHQVMYQLVHFMVLLPKQLQVLKLATHYVSKLIQFQLVQV
jgi:hypothetical protein